MSQEVYRLIHIYSKALEVIGPGFLPSNPWAKLQQQGARVAWLPDKTHLHQELKASVIVKHDNRRTLKIEARGRLEDNYKTGSQSKEAGAFLCSLWECGKYLPKVPVRHLKGKTPRGILKGSPEIVHTEE